KGTDLLRRGPSCDGCGNAGNAHTCGGRGRRSPYGGIWRVLIAACGGEVRFYRRHGPVSRVWSTEKVIPASERSENKNVSQDRDQRVRSNRSEHFSSFARRPFH